MSLNGNSDITAYNSKIANGQSGDANMVKAVIPPIGSILAWHKTYTNTPALPDGWHECDGTVISDADSPYNGQTLPNLNGPVSAGLKGYFLRGDSTSGNTQTNDVQTHTHNYWATGGSGVNGDVQAKNDGSTHLEYSTHNISTDGAETRPYTFTIVWIIRYK
jgi:hypothetical protein